MLLIAAEPSDAVIVVITSVISTLMALFVWMVRHIFTNILPQRDDQFLKALQGVSERCEKGQEAVAETIREDHRNIMGRLEQLHDDGREQVHALKNLINVLSLKTFQADAMQSMEIPAWTKTLDGVLISWNSACERLLGWSQGENVGQSIYDRIIPADRHHEEQEVLKKIAAGQQVEEYETERIHRNGRRIRLWVVTSPIRERSGRVIGASTVARPV